MRRTGTTGDVTVQLATSAGSAVAAGPTTRAVNTTITFAAGVTTRTVMVPITSDAIVEANETLTLTLSNPDRRRPIARRLVPGGHAAPRARRR